MKKGNLGERNPAFGGTLGFAEINCFSLRVPCVLTAGKDSVLCG